MVEPVLHLGRGEYAGSLARTRAAGDARERASTGDSLPLKFAADDAFPRVRKRLAFR